jgi:DNA-binding NtrC family response regulator
MQTRLLRVLEDGQVRPVGSERSRQVNVRVIAATHRDLERMVAEGTFREDLYYRLNVVSVTIPPLRERADDVPLLVRHFLALHRARSSGGAPSRPHEVTPEALAVLSGYDWPGNVRQLENEVRRAVLLCDGPIDVEHLSPAVAAAAPAHDRGIRRRTGGSSAGLSVRHRVDQLEVDLVRQALERTGGNQTNAAKLLGISRYGLHKMMKRLGLTAASRGSDD